MLVDVCADASFLLKIVVKIVKILHFAIPVLIIVFVTYDLVKTLTGPVDEKAKKDLMDKTVKRLIYAVIVFLIPTIITFVFTKIDDLSSNSTNQTPATTTSATSWIKCWVSEYNK